MIECLDFFKIQFSQRLTFCQERCWCHWHREILLPKLELLQDCNTPHHTRTERTALPEASAARGWSNDHWWRRNAPLPQLRCRSHYTKESLRKMFENFYIIHIYGEKRLGWTYLCSNSCFIVFLCTRVLSSSTYWNISTWLFSCGWFTTNKYREPSVTGFHKTVLLI